MSWTSSLDVPKTYEAAKRYFDDRRIKANTHRNLPGSTNTSIVERTGLHSEAVYAVHLHQTDIITYWPDGTVELDNYDSATTNDRRSNAGKPTIHSANSLFGHKSNRVVCDRRWCHRSANWPDELNGIGLPADKDLTLHPDGSPMGWRESTEEIWVPVPEEHKKRRELMRWARRVMTPYLDAMEQLGGVSYLAWTFTAGTLQLLRDDIGEDPDNSDATAEKLAQFCHAYAAEVSASTAWSRTGFSDRVSALAPSKRVGEWPMWVMETVRTTEIRERLDL